MNPRIESLIQELQLIPHPEGGYYREIFRSERHVGADGGRGERLGLTAIYFLLTAGQHSRWHRVLSDEAWSHLDGDPLTLVRFDIRNGQHTSVLVGRFGPSIEPVCVVPAGIWQAAEPTGEYALVSCYVGPGFEFQDFALASDQSDVTQAIRALGAGLDRFL
jgi:predicted cupin superfamily sugar epimerase